MATAAYIALGSNIEPELNVERAVRRLSEESHLTGLSRFYWTEAIGPTPQPRFLNGVARLETDLAPHALKFDLLRKIESAIGRTRNEDKYAPRMIDLDILTYADVTVATPDLTIPDPDLFERPFLAAGILDIDPCVCLPDGTPVSALFPGELSTALLCNNEFSIRMKARFFR